MKHCVWINLGAVWLIAGIAFADEPPVFEPGQTVRVDFPGVGGDHFMVYTPSDYDPSRSHPIIVCYHGLNGQPTVEPFRTNLDGKAFVIIGMGYFERGLNKRTWNERRQYNRREFEAAQRAVEYVSKYLNIHPRQRFVGGVSKGGWHSSGYAEVNFNYWSGLLIIAAGRAMPNGDANRLDLRGKPIYIGVGETDSNNQAGRKAQTAYQSRGAWVTFEEYEGLGHAAKPDSEIMRNFLLENGPLISVRAEIKKAREAEESGRLGDALGAYTSAAARLPWHDEAIAAATEAERLTAAANAVLAEASSAIEAEQYVQAFRKAHEIERQYEGSPPGAAAKKLSQQWKSDPALQSKMEQAETDARANALEAIAKDAQADEDYARALRMYGRYVETFSNATRFAEVNAHYESLLADEDIVRRARDQEAEADCKEWLNMADNYLGADRPDLAEPYLNKVIDTYPDSSWANVAKEKLAAIK